MVFPIQFAILAKAGIDLVVLNFQVADYDIEDGPGLLDDVITVRVVLTFIIGDELIERLKVRVFPGC